MILNVKREESSLSRHRLMADLLLPTHTAHLPLKEALECTEPLSELQGPTERGEATLLSGTHRCDTVTFPWVNHNPHSRILLQAA